MSEQVLGTNEVARRLHVSQGRVVNMIKDGMIEAVKVGRTWVITVSSLEECRIGRESRGVYGNQGNKSDVCADANKASTVLI